MVLISQVRIIDFDPVRFINFEAEINYPVEEGIIQVTVVPALVRMIDNW
jgi:hypothetical protein